MTPSTTTRRLRLPGSRNLGLGAGAGRAGQTIPFRSRGEILVESVIPNGRRTVLLRGRDSGNGTLLGRYTSEYRVEGRPTKTKDGTVIWKYEGEFTSTTADGDTLTARLAAQGPSRASELTAKATVLSGTGRFANVRGEWTSRAIATPAGFAYESAGQLTLPKGSAKKRRPLTAGRRSRPDRSFAL